MRKTVNTNVNYWVKVKVSEYGIKCLKDDHERLQLPYDFKTPKVDGEGFSKFQLWDLMMRFGPYILLGGRIPFETDIIIEVD